jgi:hypothetical protein
MSKITITLLFLLIFVNNSFGGFSITEENDVFAPNNKDHYYTQGLQLDYISDITQDNDKFYQYTYGLKNIFYTPSDKDVVTNQPNDRPWAGITALKYGTTRYLDKEFINGEWMLGVTGPWSYSEDIQKIVHKLIGSGDPKGWTNQIPNEVVLNYTIEVYNQLYMLGNYKGFSLDLSSIYGGSVGTAFDYINGGALFRMGYNVPKLYELKIAPTVSPYLDKFSFYTFAEADEKLTLHNITIDGSWFQDSPRQNLRPLYTDMDVGAALAYDCFKLSYSLNYRTKEFYGQEDISHYGIIIISFAKNF